MTKGANLWKKHILSKKLLRFLTSKFLDEGYDIVGLNQSREMLNVAKGKIAIGDLMFENEYEKEKLLGNLTKGQIEEIEDEYYSNIDVLKDEFRKYGKTLGVTRIDELVLIAEIS